MIDPDSLCKTYRLHFDLQTFEMKYIKEMKTAENTTVGLQKSVTHLALSG